MQAVNGSLTMVGLNTTTPSIFWNGVKVPGVLSIRVDCDDEEQRIKLKVNGTDDALYAELVASGIHIRRVL